MEQTVIQWLEKFGINAGPFVAFLETVKREHPEYAAEVDEKIALLNSAVTPEQLLVAGKAILDAGFALSQGKFNPKDAPDGAI